MRAALYARVSTEEQTEGYSLDAQVECFRRYCQDHGWQIVEEYLEPGASARSAERPVFKQMLRDAEAGLFDILVVHKLDRFSRSLRDTLNLMSDLCSWGISFVSIQEQFDFTTPSGRLQMQILGAVAEWFSSNLGQEVAKGIHQRALEGLPWGRLPTGYCWGRCSECSDLVCPDVGGEDRNDREVPILHPVDSKAIRLIFATYSKGDQTCESVAAILNSAGFRSLTRNGRRPWTRNAIDKVLRKRFYLGYVGHKGTLYQGKHKPVIDEGTFEHCRRIRRQHCKAPRTWAPKHRTYLFSGILHCDRCGQRMWADTRGTRKFYHCASRERGIDCSAPRSRVAEETLLADFERVIEAIKLPPTWRERVLELLADKDGRVEVEKERSRLIEKLRRIKSMYLEVEITEQEYREMKAKAEARLAKLSIPQERDVRQAGELLEGLSTAWNNATPEERRALVHTVFEAVYCNPVTKSLVAVQPERAFIPLLGGMDLLREDGTKFYVGR